jgi:hypothetical protein
MKHVWLTLREFFEGEDHVLSMTRLLNFLAFFPCSYIAVKISTENSLLILGGLYGGTYVAGKLSDVLVGRFGVPPTPPKE